MPPGEARQVVTWIRDFGQTLSSRTRPEDVTVRDVVLYFADRCDEFEEGCEWFYRYKAIEGFYDELSREFSLPANQIRGLYDESDLDPRVGRAHSYAPASSAGGLVAQGLLHPVGLPAGSRPAA